MDRLIQDLRYSVRMLLKTPAFTAVAIIALALGIGVNSTIFSFVNGILLKPLPFDEPERLVFVNETSHKRGTDSMGISFPNFLDWREQNTVFDHIAIYMDSGFSLAAGDEPERLQGAYVSYGLFETLRVSPILGRSISPEEDHPENDMVVLLSHGLWQRRFAGDPDIINQTLTINGRSRTVIGVMPPDFRFPIVSELWAPLGLDTKSWTRTDHGLAGVARLKAGVSLSQARSEMDRIALSIEEANPVTNDGMGVKLTPLHEQLSGGFREGLMILLGAVAFVLLIACANVANLLLTRATARQKEISIRTALGARRSHIVRQLLTESLLLGALGGGLGLLLAWWGVDLLLAVIPVDLPYWMKFNLDGRVVGFTVLISLLTSIVFGLVPALQASRSNLNESLKEGTKGSTLSPGRARLRGLLVISEVALSLVLLVGAGLMVRSFLSLQSVNPGFDPKNVLTFNIGLPGIKYPQPQQRATFFKQLQERIESLPGVESVSAISNLPISGGSWGRSLTVEGFPVLGVGEAPMINHRVIMPNYFRTMGIEMIEGRDFTNEDVKDGPHVVIINRRLADTYWPGSSALGKRIRLGPPENEEPWHTIVGVVGDVQHDSLNSTVRIGVYIPLFQIGMSNMTFVARTSSSPLTLAAAVRNQVKEMDNIVPVVNLRTMEEVLSRSVWQQRLYTILFGIFAGVALVLASVGIYGVISYSVAQRTHEIGIRMALGARPRDVLSLVLGQGMMLVSIGLAIGLAGAFALTRLMSSLLFKVSATDLSTFIVIPVILAGVALGATFVPARRATRVDPMVALRYE